MVYAYKEPIPWTYETKVIPPPSDFKVWLQCEGVVEGPYPVLAIAIVVSSGAGEATYCAETIEGKKYPRRWIETPDLLASEISESSEYNAVWFLVACDWEAPWFNFGYSSDDCFLSREAAETATKNSKGKGTR